MNGPELTFLFVDRKRDEREAVGVWIIVDMMIQEMLAIFEEIVIDFH